MIAICAAGAQRLVLPVGANTTTGVDRPDACRVVRLRIGRPPILRDGESKHIGVQRRVDPSVVENTESLVAGGQPPVALAANAVGLRIDHGIGPGHLAAIGLLPDEASDVVRHGAVAVVGKRGRVDAVIGILPISSRVAVGLAGIRQIQHAPCVGGWGAGANDAHQVRITAAGRGGRIAGRQAEVILSRDVIAHARSCWKCRDLSSVNIVAGSTVLMRTVVQHGDRVGDTPDNIGQRGRGDAMAIRDARGHPHADGGRWHRRIDCRAADGRCGDVGR